ncbi:MAG: DUF1501 domain-containing protein [Flavobacteriaceae bacterium]|nr:DUF1501 domain-containing protein [Flavobacteriaceae bacterium]
MKRRKFIKSSALSSSVLLAPSFIKAMEQINIELFGYKKLVIIQLTGGNDGLNTVIPYRNDLYYKARPKIALKKNKTINLNGELGLHYKLTALKRLYDQGYLTIINNVGYPNPSRSHFRSSDIWHSASDANSFLSTGWIGRYLDHYGKKPHSAIEIDESLSLMLKGNKRSGIATKNANFLYRALHESKINDILSYQRHRHLSEHNLGYLYKTLVDAKSSARYLQEKTKLYRTYQSYPNNPLARQLKTIAKFINSGLETRIYYASLTGFDTHANQLGRQERLLDVFGNSIYSFINDLKKGNTFKDTLVITFSEFGRRPQQNAAGGTDHGTANNVFLFGENLKNKGLYNKLTSLKNLDNNGDLKYEIDFREIYASILNNWLEVDDERILKKSFNKLNLI